MMMAANDHIQGAKLPLRFVASIRQLFQEQALEASAMNDRVWSRAARKLLGHSRQFRSPLPTTAFIRTGHFALNRGLARRRRRSLRALGSASGRADPIANVREFERAATFAADFVYAEEMLGHEEH